MRKFLREPLLHFLLIGAALFALFDMFSAPTESLEKLIVISSGDLEALQANFARTWQRPPTEQELQGLIEQNIRDEIAYREAMSMGLDQDDTFIRRRLRMKLELLLEDLAVAVPPSTDQLEAYLVQNRQKFAIEPRLSLSQVYLNPEKHGAALGQRSAALLEQLRSRGKNGPFDDLGDPIMLPGSIPLSSVNTLSRQFGKEFTEAIKEIEPGTWQGPIRSSYGLHFVLVHEYIAGRNPELDEVRPVVERELLAEQRTERLEQAYQALRDRYIIEIEIDTEQKPGA
jgi:hypothetical protein